MIFFSSGSCAGELWGAKIKSCTDSLCVGGDTGKSRKDILVNQELPSPFLVLSTTKLTMMGIRQMGVMTRAKTVAGGGSLNSSVGHSLKYVEWISTNICSTSGLGHGIWRQSDISSVQMLKLLYKLVSQKKQKPMNIAFWVGVWRFIFTVIGLISRFGVSHTIPIYSFRTIQFDSPI